MNQEKTNTDVLQKVRDHVRKGTYLLREHAIRRQKERQIRLPDILSVLQYGWHEKEKDIFDVKYQCWKYAIRGKTANEIDLRVIIAFQDKMAIITVIKVQK